MNKAVFAARCRSILTDNAGRRYVGAQRSGSVDSSRIGYAAVGSAAIFKKPLVSAYRAYEIAILLDASGSMFVVNPERARCALPACVDLVNGLRSSGATVTLDLINRDRRSVKFSELPELERIYRSWSSERFGRTERYSGTHDAHFLAQKTAEILQSPAPARIILCLTDGEPRCDYCDCHKPGCARDNKTLQENLKAAVIKARAAGVIVLAVGICTESSRHYYGEKQTRCILRPSEIYGSAAALLEANLHRG